MLDPEARRQALCHPSWAPDPLRSYERLEFLGDAVLGVIVTDELMARHPDRLEGDLTWMRQAVVSRDACAVVAHQCGLPDAMVAEAPPARQADARELASSRNVRAALAESVIGAGWLGPGPDATRAAVLGAFGDAIGAAHQRGRDAKTALQERVQAVGGHAVHYEITGHDGPPQDRTFHARVLQGRRQVGQGSGRSKQAAEQAAAEAALRAMDEGA